MQTSGISVVIHTKNAAQTVSAALKSVENFATEIIVVDMRSSDATVEIAKEAGAKVFPFEKDLAFADPARNFALSKASCPWIFVLDADETLTPGLREQLKKIVQGNVEAELQGDCYFVPRSNVIFGKALEKTGWWPDYQMRFFRSGTVSWTPKVHTHPKTTGVVIHLPANVENAIIHQNYQSVEQFIDRLNRYTSLELDSRTDEKAITSASILSRFSGEFFRRFFVESGIEEGVHGVSLSLLQSFYELTVELKKWQEKDFSSQASAEENFRAVAKFRQDLSFWLADYRVRRTSGVAKIYWQIRRKCAQLGIVL